MEKNASIYVAGHLGMVGSAIVRKLKAEGYYNLLLRTSKELDLRDQRAVRDFFAQEKPEYVFLAAAKVGGIMANNIYRAAFLYDNLMIEANVIHHCHIYGVKKMLFLGSSCIYPKMAPQPLREEYLLTGPLEPTNEPYAIAKIAGIKLCETYRHQFGNNFISALPTNLYGFNDNYDLESSHVLPALIRKFHEAKINRLPYTDLWGTGAPLREFMYVDDLAAACLHLMLTYNEALPVNIGTGKDLSIKDLALTIKNIVGFEGEIRWDSTKPDGTPRKILDVTKLHATGFKADTSLEKGIKLVYKDFTENYHRYTTS